MRWFWFSCPWARGGFVVSVVGAEIEGLFDQDLFSTLQARTIDDAQDLIDLYLVERTGFLPILPPGDEEFVQPVAPMTLFRLDGREHLRGVKVATADIGAYADLLSSAGGGR